MTVHFLQLLAGWRAGSSGRTADFTFRADLINTKFVNTITLAPRRVFNATGSLYRVLIAGVLVFHHQYYRVLQYNIINVSNTI